MSNGKLLPVRNPGPSLGTPLRLVAARSQLAPSEPLRRSLEMPHPRGGWETQPVFPILRRHLTPYAKRKVFDGPKASDGTDKASKRPAFDLVGREAETG